MRYRLVPAALLVLAGLGPAAAQSGGDGDLLSIHGTLNGMCRGWSGDDPHTQEVCDLRESVGAALKRRGYCFGRAGEPGARKVWHRCGPDSLR